MKVSCLQKFTPNQMFHKVQTLNQLVILGLNQLVILIYVNDMPDPTHNKTNKSQFADDAGQ